MKYPNEHTESDNSIIDRFIKCGIKKEKIYNILPGATFLWSKTRNTLVGISNYPDSLELDLINNKLTYENNQILIVDLYDKLDSETVSEINNSKGIVISNWLYGESHFRFTIIPKDEIIEKIF